ncbi:hypothetical protein MAPG_04309 [Magnaporthiopsis poae ATCC 64411]|uniref:Uncharacterized protein n=1 Tax=Magnaporthiopsis poae (strain ATCC 64411 / 73-15) TaxID=644358 RepID=A0A0C4DWD3_MAGP6|nr:hypothetical protein MAPG_04309 [Magnaporthiopsis poae ATCC 64411]
MRTSDLLLCFSRLIENACKSRLRWGGIGSGVPTRTVRPEPSQRQSASRSYREAGRMRMGAPFGETHPARHWSLFCHLLQSVSFFGSLSCCLHANIPSVETPTVQAKNGVRTSRYGQIWPSKRRRTYAIPHHCQADGKGHDSRLRPKVLISEPLRRSHCVYLGRRPPAKRKGARVSEPTRTPHDQHAEKKRPLNSVAHRAARPPSLASHRLL